MSTTSSDAVLDGCSDLVLVAALRARDEGAYVALVRRYTPLMLRVAQAHVTGRAVAEDVVQDTWLAVLQYVDRFEGRSSFKTWLMRILVNTARTRALRDSRTVCWSGTPADEALWDDALRNDQADAVHDPEVRAIAGETYQVIMAALSTLPQRQQMVVVLRDVEGWSSEEVCALLRISPGNQRLLLHRGRNRLRELIGPLLLEPETKEDQVREPG